MKIFLDNKLAEHRRGRFFATHLDAVPVGDEPPQAGLVLMTGNQYQSLDEKSKAGWWSWISKSGRTLLLIPPFDPGRLGQFVDWEMAFRDQVLGTTGVTVPDLLCEEVSFEILGQVGEVDQTLGHRWPDGSVNTRYAKKHSGTGVFAVTCLPLWSISLLDNAAALDGWLRALHEYAGEVASDEDLGDGQESNENALTHMDYGLLVGLYAWHTADSGELIRANQTSPVPLFTLDQSTVVTGIAKLRDMGILSDSGLTERGLAVLQSSPFWGYAVGLREEVA